MNKNPISSSEKKNEHNISKNTIDNPFINPYPWSCYSNLHLNPNISFNNQIDSLYDRSLEIPNDQHGPNPPPPTPPLPLSSSAKPDESSPQPKTSTKRVRKTGPSRKLLPLISNGINPNQDEKEAPEGGEQALAERLANKSNYQLLLEAQDLGVSDPKSTQIIEAKKKAHKEAERLRRLALNEQYALLKKELKISEKESKYTTLYLAKETLEFNQNFLDKQEKALIKLLSEANIKFNREDLKDLDRLKELDELISND